MARIVVALVLAGILSTSTASAATGAGGCASDCQQCGPGGGCPGTCYGCRDNCQEGACTADGVCYPKRSTWGFYRQRWGRWPGDFEDPLPEGRARASEGSQIPEGLPDIDKTEEELRAPPSSEESAEDETDEEEPGAEGESSLPPLPPLSAPPRAGDFNPPPALPGGFPPPSAPGPNTDFSMNSPPAIQAAYMEQDAPPALPATLANLIQASPVRPAVYAPTHSKATQDYAKPAAAHLLPRVR